MLVLSRKLGEKLCIGDNVVITVVDIDRGKIRLGIEAPRDVPIYRQELLPLVAPLPPAPPANDDRRQRPCDGHIQGSSGERRPDRKIGVVSRLLA